MKFVKCFQKKFPTFIELLAEKCGLGGCELEDRRKVGRGSFTSSVSADA
jgi:hypothetical protein